MEYLFGGAAVRYWELKAFGEIKRGRLTDVDVFSTEPSEKIFGIDIMGPDSSLARKLEKIFGKGYSNILQERSEPANTGYLKPACERFYTTKLKSVRVPHPEIVILAKVYEPELVRRMPQDLAEKDLRDIESLEEVLRKLGRYEEAISFIDRHINKMGYKNLEAYKKALKNAGKAEGEGAYLIGDSFVM